MSEAELIIEGFAGPGGWGVAAARLGLSPVVGFEIDAAACATRAAAGHLTIRADVSRYPAESLRGRVKGSIWSPVCTMFSAAGSRAGVAVLDELGHLIRDMFAGRKTRAQRRRSMVRLLRAAGWPPVRMRPSRWNKKYKIPVRLTREERSAAIWKAVRSASLVAEPARFIAACRPEWVAMEQVPEVLPLWRIYAEELRKMGYSTWCGKLNAAHYGVPQTRERAILIASRVRQVRRPEPTHYDPRKGMQLWGTPWVSMAEALGWGATGRPGPAVTAGGTATGGAEPFARGGRDALGAEQGAGRWTLRRDRGAGMTSRTRDVRDRELTEPAPPITAGYEGSGAGARLSWKFRNNNNNACERSLDDPAGTLFFGGRSNWAAWVQERPATTVQGGPRIGRPGHKDRDKGETQFEQDSVRVTVEEAAALQSFPPGYPWQGTKTARFRQVGDAIPPLLAEHVLAMAAGVVRAERAA